MPTSDFRKLVKSRVDDEVSKYLTSIQQKIIDNKLQGHNFYIYVLPFTDINSKRKKINGGYYKMTWLETMDQSGVK